MQHSLAVFAVGKRASTEMSLQLKRFFPNDTIAISAYCLAELQQQSAKVPVKADLAVISSPTALISLKQFIHPSTPTIIARRNLSLKVIDQLMDLPAGTKALLVTKTPGGTTGFLKTIQEMGISHLSLYSFLTDEYTLCSSITTVLLADEPEQIPPWASKIIDLGVREIELSSLIEIANELNYHLNISSPISTHYIQEMVTRNESLIQTLRAVLNNIHDAIIVVNADYTIRFLNNVACDLIGTDSIQAIGSSLYDVFPEIEKTVPLNYSFPVQKKVFSLKNQVFHTSIQAIKDTAGQLISSIITLRNVTEVIQMEKEVRGELKKLGHLAKYTFSDIIGQSDAIRNTVINAHKLAASDLNIFIYGENGTGKELFAQSIHNVSPRANNPFIAANCAALPSSLLESELFGYEDGAFTGAKRGGKPGLIEQADGGTIFLDEIGDIPLDTQARLLRVIQEKEIMRVSSTRIISVDVRFIVATNKNPLDLIDKGTFRQDLFYRLYVAPLDIPPLRKRPDDIPLLLHYFMRNNNVDEAFLDNDLLEQLIQYPWPGNIRELQNFIQYASVIGKDPPSFKKAILRRIDHFSSDAPLLPLNLQLDELPLYAAILTLFQKAKQRNVRLGRGILIKQLKARNITISEQSIRSKMVKLKQAGFLNSGIGRQGTEITSQGETFLAMTNRHRLTQQHTN